MISAVQSPRATADDVIDPAHQRAVLDEDPGFIFAYLPNPIQARTTARP